ncbi:MAG: hypothetical protein JW741_17010, partial [Sedimentisphaerales bacterium]|nr:hypothetical protein [Sedimentisphaerales bacterium]
HYQVMFTMVRNPASANSMQIAEVELIGVPYLTRYTYDGGALDDLWDHDNGSDAWDDSAPGEGSPGGVGPMVEEGVTFLRIQDTGDPRDYGMPDPSNRKIYLTHRIPASLDGAHVEIGIRVATGAGLDDLHPDGGTETSPWPEGGTGYHIRDNGKGMVGISDGEQVISFSLAKAGEIAGVETDALVMNNLVGTEPSGDVDTGDAGVANVLAIDDATAWNDLVIDIVAGGSGTHVVTVSVNGAPAQSFDVTSGTGTEENYAYIAVGSSGTGPVTAFDVDYVTVVPISAPAAPVIEAPVFVEDFESYAAGTDLHGVNGWKGWDNTASAGAPVSDAFAFSGANSVELVGTADLVHEFAVSGDVVQFSAMQYIPAGSAGSTYFILMNQYGDGGPYDWSVQLKFDLGAGIATAEAEGGGATAQILFDEWVEILFVIDLDANTCDWYYGGTLVTTHPWDNDAHGTLQAIDLFGNGASPVYYDDITIQ